MPSLKSARGFISRIVSAIEKLASLSAKADPSAAQLRGAETVKTLEAGKLEDCDLVESVSQAYETDLAPREDKRPVLADQGQQGRREVEMEPLKLGDAKTRKVRDALEGWARDAGPSMGLAAALLTLLHSLSLAALAASPYFIVQVVDEATGRGVPLVELKLPNEVRYYTDSAGRAAVLEPSFEGLQVYTMLRSHGYDHSHKTFWGPGVNLDIRSGATQTVKIRRSMIAERLYRLTGEGIYRDSHLAGLAVPLRQPLLNGQVVGQDTVGAAPYKGRIFWIWGDTTGPATHNFSVSAAVSDTPGQGGLDPSIGVDYRYFTEASGRVKAMLPLPRKGLVWIEGLFTVRDPQGQERLLATYTRQQGLTPAEECGVARFNDERELFEPWLQTICRGSHVSSHPVLHREGDRQYWYLYPGLRIPNDWSAVQNQKSWEKREVKPSPGMQAPASIVWNEYRKRWIGLIQVFGEVFYAEADRPEGPWGKAISIVRHDHYNFYNVALHPFFDQEGGRIVYFEGTYTDAFTDAKEKTPRYDYNQIMHRLRLDDPRLKPARGQ